MLDACIYACMDAGLYAASLKIPLLLMLRRRCSRIAEFGLLGGHNPNFPLSSPLNEPDKSMEGFPVNLVT